MPTLGYWDIRGLAGSIRSLLHFKGVEFEDKRYYFTGEIEDKRVLNLSGISEEWKNDKFQLNLDFPNLPYYIDGKIRLTQSTTILRYLARKHDLLGKNEDERVRAELAEQQITDFRMNICKLCYNPEFETIKGEFALHVPDQLKLFSDFLGNRKFLAGDNITYVDFMAYDTFDFYRLVFPTILNDFPNLKKYVDRIENLPELKGYFQSSTYIRWPLFSPFAYFGGEGPEPKHV